MARGSILSAQTLSSSNSNPFLQIAFNFEDGDGSTKYINLYLTENAMPYTRRKLEQLGFNGDFENPLFTVGYFEVQVVQEQYEGNMIEKYDVALPPRNNKMDTAAIKKLNARWKTTK